MSDYRNYVKMTVTSAVGGTGTITLNAASSGFRSFATAYGADATVDVLITEGSAWEVARNCTYTHSGPTLTRGTLENASTGSALSLTSAATVEVVLPASAINEFQAVAGVFGSDVVSITGGTTLTSSAVGRMHHCTGTSADYTVTLPAASGNAGKLIGFRMGSAAGLTKLVTLDGNASETIDGALTRVMFSQETALLFCDGSNWFKISGRTRPMIGLAAPSANTTVPTGGNTRINLNTSVIDTCGAMCDTANNEIVIRRPGQYKIAPVGRISNASAAISRWYAGTWRVVSGVTTQWIVLSELSVASGAYAFAQCAVPYTCAFGDQMRLYVGGTNGGNETCAGTGTTENSFMLVEEMPSW